MAGDIPLQRYEYKLLLVPLAAPGGSDVLDAASAQWGSAGWDIKGCQLLPTAVIDGDVQSSVLALVLSRPVND